jgi:hypothetical protein
MALMRFAHVAKSGTDSNEMDGLAAMYDLLEPPSHPDEWDRFQAHAIKTRATRQGPDDARPQGDPRGDRTPYFAALRLLGWAGEHVAENSEDDSSSPADLHLRVVQRLETRGVRTRR